MFTAFTGSLLKQIHCIVYHIGNCKNSTFTSRLILITLEKGSIFNKGQVESLSDIGHHIFAVIQIFEGATISRWL